MYNPYFYQPQMVSQAQMLPQNQTQMATQPIIQRKFDIVQGKIAAETYPVDAGSELYLMDMDNPFIYRKARGFDNRLEPMEVYRLERVTDEPKQEEKIDLSGFITQETLDNYIENEIEKRIKDEVDRRLSEISFAPTKKPTRKGDNV